TDSSRSTSAMQRAIIACACGRSGWTSVIDASAPIATPLQTVGAGDAGAASASPAGIDPSTTPVAAIERKRRRLSMTGSSVALVLLRPGGCQIHRAEHVVIGNIVETDDPSAVAGAECPGRRLRGERHRLRRAHAS